MNKEMNEAI